MCLTSWVKKAKVSAQTNAMCFIMKAGGSSVTRLNEDIGLRHARPEPVDNDNIYKMEEEQSTLRMKTLTSGAAHSQGFFSCN